MKNKILLITDALNIGGAEKIFLGEGIILKRKGINQTIIYSKGGGTLLNQFHSQQIFPILIDRKYKFDIIYIYKI